MDPVVGLNTSVQELEQTNTSIRGRMSVLNVALLFVILMAARMQVQSTIMTFKAS